MQRSFLAIYHHPLELVSSFPQQINGQSSTLAERQALPRFPLIVRPSARLESVHNRHACNTTTDDRGTCRLVDGATARCDCHGCQGKTRREKLLLDVEEIMRSGLKEATAPSAITQHRATRRELLNYVSSEGLSPLHYLCDGNWTARPSICRVLNGPRGRAVSASSDPCDNGCPDSSERVDILGWLLSEEEMDPMALGPQGRTALHFAARVKEPHGLELCRMLIKTGIDLDALAPPFDMDDALTGNSFTNTILSTSEEATCAARKDGSKDHATETSDAGRDSEGVEAIVGGPVSTRDGSRNAKRLFSALQVALKSASWDTAQLLVSAGASVQPPGAFPPCLHMACHGGAPANLIARLILGRKSDVLLDPTSLVSDRPGAPRGWLPKMDSLECYGATPLFLAARTGSLETVQLLLPLCHETPRTSPLADGTISPGGDCSSRNAEDRAGPRLSSSFTNKRDGLTPLHAAAAAGHTSVARVLLQGGGSPWLNTTDHAGRVPLDHAVGRGRWEVALLLASWDGFDVRLAIDGGPSSALLCAERANMALVDQGSGEASALTALRDTNALIITLLERLRDLDSNNAVDETGPDTNAIDEAASVDSCTSGPRAREPTSGSHHDAGSTEDNVHSNSTWAKGAKRGLSSSIHHLHPCYADGILYSNAKGVRIPHAPQVE